MTREALNRLLTHPALWRGAQTAPIETVSTGFPALDHCLPGGGWPRAGLIELLIPRLGIGELPVLMPALRTLTQSSTARWCAWVSPPLEPFAPALSAHGLALSRLLVVRAQPPLWALERCLGSGACDSVLAWVRQVSPREVRRLQLAAEKGHTLGVMFRSLSAAREASPAMLRLLMEPTACGVRLTLLKSRGGRRGPIHLESFW